MTRAPLRVPFLALALIALLAALWAGWIRIGWDWPPIQPSLPGVHGPLMVAGFLGTLIALERAVALRQRWMYLGPLFSGIGGLVMLSGINNTFGTALLTVGSLFLVAIFYEILRQHTAWYTVTMALGALAFCIGNVLWLLGWSIPRVVLWWQTFLVLTIAGERLELGRLLRLPKHTIWAFFITMMIMLLGLSVSAFSLATGVRIFCLGLVAIAIWLFSNDISRRTVHQRGLPRYVAICLLPGFAWLAIGGVMGLIYGAQAAGPIYDAILHTVFVGFVISMIFGHAPIIFPAILGLSIQYHPIFYTHLILLHASLVLRIIGDIMFNTVLRQWGGLLNGIAIILFLVLTAMAMAIPRRVAQLQS